ncbi:hypothetical protein [Ilumatobacter sp.]|uniref:hypothetical protein n=1 Tax=Ilumatobacter sp. TaxID=1967498 RepID=UPI003C6197A3
MTTFGTGQARPPLAIRLSIGLIGACALAFNVVLMISDRAPRVTREIFGDFAQRLSDRLDASTTVDTGRLPGNDAIVHIGVWAFAALLVALTLWRWWGLLVTATAVFAASIVVEIGQGRYSSSRAVESSDVTANAVGVMVGTVVAAGCMLLWSAVSAAVRGSRRPSR